MRALITGVAGQDGSYLAEFLLEKGYEVYGLKLSTDNLQNIVHLKNQIKLLDGDLNNTADVFRAVQTSMPDEIYNLAGMSYVGNSWDFASLVRETNFFGVQRLLHAVQVLKPSAKVYQASSCEMFGGVDVFPQNELTAFKPVSPYAESKLEAHLLMQSMRKQMFTSNGILFNHERMETYGYRRS